MFEDTDRVQEEVWNTLLSYQGHTFRTYRGLEFTYTIKCNEIFFSRKEKSVTRASVEIAVNRVLELERRVSGPKKLKIFGASYVYPVFLEIGLITVSKGE